MTLTVDFCGEVHHLLDEDSLILGREGDLAVDDNPYLHRHFLRISNTRGLWWLSNIGSQLAATVSDRDGLVQAWLAPGGQLPLVVESVVVLFTAGPTTYELDLTISDAPFSTVPSSIDPSGATTVGPVSLTPDQRLLVVAISEPALRGRGTAGSRLPSNADAAERLGWSLTRFNRKLDNVCQKLTTSGVRGLHGRSDQLASSRRNRLVEYAVATRLVTSEDLALLPPTGPAEIPGVGRRG